MIRGYVIRGRKKFKIWWQTIPQIIKFSPQCLLSFVIGFCQNVFWTSNFSSHSSFNKTNAKMVENNIRVSFQDAKSSWYNHQSALQAMCNVFIRSFIYELLCYIKDSVYPWIDEQKCYSIFNQISRYCHYDT